MGRVALHLPGASGGGGATPSGRLLSSLSEGTIVMLDENGVGKKFVFLQHNHYGKNECTLLRKDTLAPRVWSSGNDNRKRNMFNGSEYDMFFSGQYTQWLDPAMRDCLVRVPIPVVRGYIKEAFDSTIELLPRKCFPLSRTEVGLDDCGPEGTVFPYFSSGNARNAYYDGTSVTANWGLRSPDNGSSGVLNVHFWGQAFYAYDVSDAVEFATRPALTLPAQVLVASSPDGSGSFYVVGIPKHGGGYYVRDPEGYWV